MRDALPPLLVTPPWERRTPLVPGLQPPAERVVDWLPGEREAWQKQCHSRTYFTAALNETHRLEGWEGVVREFLNGQITYEPALFSLFGLGPEELVRPLLPNWHPKLTLSSDFSILHAVTVRFGADAHHVVFPNAKKHHVGWALMPFRDVEVARLMATWLGMSSASRQAGEWFERHEMAAVPYLVPDALGTHRGLRDKAVTALFHIASRCGDAEVVETARPYGDQAADTLARVLAGDAPASRPRPVSWLDLKALPEIHLKDGRPLPRDAVKHLVGALTLSPGVKWNGPPEIYPGLEEALDQCDRATLATFGWAVLNAWESAGQPSNNRWVIDQFIWLADDEIVRRLGALALDGPASAKHITGVLGDIGTDAALVQLNRIAHQARSGLRDIAIQERLAWAAGRHRSAGRNRAPAALAE